MIEFPLDSLQREDYFSTPDYPSELLTPSGPIMLGDRVVEVSIVQKKTPVTQAHLDAFARFLNDYAKMELPFAVAIKARYVDDEGYLIEWLEEELEPSYWSALFPGCKSAAEVSADQYFKALTLVSISFHPEPAPDDEEIVADYRFCIPESKLLPDNSTNFQRYLDWCDLTDQVHAVKAMLNGHLLGVDLES